jgi:hypothetical protein
MGSTPWATSRAWWQVDLEQAVPLGRIVIYNRCDGKVEDRAARIEVLLSDDGKAVAVAVPARRDEVLRPRRADRR